MAVYVDKAAWWWRGKYWCHLTADTLIELHEFAQKLGLGLPSFQRPPKTPYPHYDLTEGKRAKALKLGAIELLDRREFIGKVRKLREELDEQEQETQDAEQD